ncbi:ATP-binding protein [Streptomyces sp. NBC_00347]|uniref:ATP-binding protein n=1 Tax=Streptomyces sp. NBC_00347 TaxID=2975721 RepID=UPI002259C834|nr:ATP-binding protein [Streptomyces sp. NBC_00347]MCX5126709.1 ATP-binding protein [Streptomyces sp. NBC_00347]
MTSAEQSDRRARTPHLHQNAQRPQSALCVMPAAAAAVPTLRRLTRRLIEQWHLPEEVGEAAALIVTELAANVVRHSGSPEVALRITVGDGRVAVQVRDFGQWRSPRPRSGGAMAGGGRGLDLVGAFATGCEILSTGAGTRATASIALPV